MDKEPNFSEELEDIQKKITKAFEIDNENLDCGISKYTNFSCFQPSLSFSHYDLYLFNRYFLNKVNILITSCENICLFPISKIYIKYYVTKS
jgi:hypothetical protein